MGKGIPHDMIHGSAELTKSTPVPPRVIDFLPYVFPPDRFVPFDVVNSQAILAATTVTIPIFGPVNAYGVIRWFANEGALPADVPFLLWTIIVGGVPSQPYINMLLSRGSIDNPDPIIIRVQPNQVVTVNVQNTDAGAPHTARTRVKGWLY
jgi:hypothetical protein